MPLTSGAGEPADDDIDDVLTLPDGPPTDAQGRRSMTGHRDYLLSLIEPLTPFGINLLDAWGLNLCEDIKADGDLPPVPVAETDGYAFNFEDIAATPPGARPALTLAEAPAPARALDEPAPRKRGRKAAPAEDDVAEPAERRLGIGEALPVKAGDALPEGADTVVAGWQARLDDTGHHIRIVLLTKAVEGDWVRQVGVEARDGEVLAAAGTLLNDRRSALLASAGFDRVMARPRTRVTIVHVTDGNTPAVGADGRAAGTGMQMVNGAARIDGATVYRVEIDLTALPYARERLSDELIRADLVLTVGGLTDDGADPRLIELLESMGVIDVADVAMLPGSCHGVGLIGDDRTPVVMLPTDPSALLVAYHAFARPAIRKLMGVEPFVHDPVLCFAERNFDAELDLVQLVPCRLRQDGNRYLAGEITPRRHSQLPTLVDADALILLPGDKARVYAGEAVAAWLLDDQRIATK